MTVALVAATPQTKPTDSIPLEQRQYITTIDDRAGVVNAAAHIQSFDDEEMRLEKMHRRSLRLETQQKEIRNRIERLKLK